MAEGDQQVPPIGTQGGTPPAGEKTETFDAEYVKKLREEAAEHRTKKVAAEAELKRLQDAQLSDAEKASKRLAELEAAHGKYESERRDLQARLAVEREARKLGVVDEDAAYRLLDVSKLQFDDAGHPTNASEMLKELVKTRPFLSGQVSQGSAPQTSAANPASSRTTQSGTFSRSQLNDPAFYEKNRTEILAAVREGRIVD